MDADQVNGNTFKRRTRVPDKPNHNISLWSMIKSFIGKDLTKIPLPVNFNEPLSMLQRFVFDFKCLDLTFTLLRFVEHFRSAEDYEYSELLDKAAQCHDPAEQFAYVAAFTMSTYSTTSERVAKPFNPLLGETFECDRTCDLGWKLVSEQVSHHPPMLALFCESKNGWKCSQELQLSSKFRGNNIMVVPSTFSRITFPATKTSFIFDRPSTSAYNLMFGKLYLEHSGEVTIVGEGKAKGWKCVLSYQSHSFFSKDQRSVKGTITDANGKVKMTLNAQWDDKMEMTANGNSTTIWRKRAPLSDAYLYYNFTIFASQLNEMEANIAPTDSRLRSDQRLMENGNWDASNREKLRLEEQQRERRRMNQEHKPLWFERSRDDTTGEMVWKYTGKYWQCKDAGSWKMCPKIF